MKLRISRNRCRITDLEDLTEGSRQMDPARIQKEVKLLSLKIDIPCMNEMRW